MMDKFIFLDIDGVLAIPSCLKNGMWALSDEKQKLLGEIIKGTDAKIVLSSSWRYSTVEETKANLNKEGFLFNDRLVGVTIRAYQWLEKGTGIHLPIPRGVEIKQWIDTNVHSDNGKNWDMKELNEDFTYVIIDDDTDMLLEQKDNFIVTDGEIGITNNDVKSAIRILNNKLK